MKKLFFTALGLSILIFVLGVFASQMSFNSTPRGYEEPTADIVKVTDFNGRTTWLLDANGIIYDGGIGRTVETGIAYSVTAGHIGYAEGTISTITIGPES